MKHQHKNRILSRTATARRQLLQNLSSSLLSHGSIVTTEAKAKELRRFLEPLVTKAKGEVTLGRRRQLLAQLVSDQDLSQLLKVAKASHSRPGGYLRLTKLVRSRGDGAQEVRIEFVDSF